MDKRWYPVAFSVAIVGCGGDVDSGSPAATGGLPAAFYGIMISTGGSTGIDTGTPNATGGQIFMVDYGPVSVLGGGSVGIAGKNSGGSNATATGGSASIDGGLPITTGGHFTVYYGIN